MGGPVVQVAPRFGVVLGEGDVECRGTGCGGGGEGVPGFPPLLVELFEARFDPCTGKESKAEIKAGIERLTQQLQALAGGDEAVLAALQPVIEARNGKREQQIDVTRSPVRPSSRRSFTRSP